MAERWDREQVLALAPDAPSQRAAKSLASGRAWPAAGAAVPGGTGSGGTGSGAVWGECRVRRGWAPVLAEAWSRAAIAQCRHDRGARAWMAALIRRSLQDRGPAMSAGTGTLGLLGQLAPAHRTLVPERLVGYARKQQAVARDVILCLDQSGSMASSVVYAGVFGAVLASIRSLRTSVVAFDTSVADLTEQLSDPVDVLFGTQLGGGTDINHAVGYCQRLITRPSSTIFILISDLFEGGDRDEMLRRVADMTAAGTQVIALLALSDDGAPGYHHGNAAALAAMGVAAFACTPDMFPGLMAAAIERRDITQWARRHRPAAGHHP